jgi:hypothetical protein
MLNLSDPFYELGIKPKVAYLVYVCFKSFTNYRFNLIILLT